MKRIKKICFVLAITAQAIMFMSCRGTATTMRLVKTEGTVDVADGQGTDVAVKKNLGLYSGYQLETETDSYAWIDLDKSKLAKLDTESRAHIQKEGSRLEITADEGNLFFNVSQPLEQGESMDIRTSSMIVGIRGTCGWVSVRDESCMEVYILEGTVECSVTPPDAEQTVTAVVSNGERGIMTFENGQGNILVEQFEPSAVPGFVLDELEDNSLNDRVTAGFGTDIRQWTQSVITAAMPMTDLEVMDLLNTDGVDTVILTADGENNTLVVEHDFSNPQSLRVFEDKTLILAEGTSMAIDEGALSILGRLEVNGDITINGGYLNTQEMGTVLVTGSIMAESQGSKGNLQNHGSMTIRGGLVSHMGLTLVKGAEINGDVTVDNNGDLSLNGTITGNLTLYSTEHRAAMSVGMNGTVNGTVTLERGSQSVENGTYNKIVVNGGTLWVGDRDTPLALQINELVVNGGTVNILQIPNVTIGSVINNGGEINYREVN